MNEKLDLIEIEENVERVWSAAVQYEKSDDKVHAVLPEKQIETCGNNADVMMNIARSKVKGLIVVELNRIYAKRTQAEVQLEVKVAHGTGKTSTWFSKMIVVKLISCEAAEDDIAQCPERWSNSDTFMNTLVKRFLCSQFFARPVSRFTKKLAQSTID